MVTNKLTIFRCGTARNQNKFELKLTRRPPGRIRKATTVRGHYRSLPPIQKQKSRTPTRKRASKR